MPTHVTILDIYNKAILCHNLCRSLLASWFLSDLWPIPAVCVYIHPLYIDIFPFVFYCSGNVRVQVSVDFIWSLANDSMHAMCEKGGKTGSCWWRLFLHEYVCGIIMERNLLCQDEARSRVPVRLPVPQGNGKSRSVYHAGLRPYYCD